MLQGLNLPVLEAPQASEPEPSLPAPAALSEDELHMERLREFFAENRPENVSRVPELFAKVGTQAWAALELKYPGKTAKFTVVRTCTHPVFPSVYSPKAFVLLSHFLWDRAECALGYL